MLYHQLTAVSNPCFPFYLLQRTADERFEARQDAARGAINIDGEERRRRLVFGGSLLVLPMEACP